MAKVVYTDEIGREHTVSIGPDQPLVTVGRAKDCTIRSAKKSVSRHHAELHFNEDGCEVVDLNSSNGTFVIINGEREPIRGREKLTHRDEIWFGDFAVRFLDETQSRDRHGRPTQEPAMAGASAMSGAAVSGAAMNGSATGPGDAAASGASIDIADPDTDEDWEAGPTGSFDEADYEEIEPEVIGDADEDPYETIARLREERAALEDLAERQADELDQLREKSERLDDDVERLEQQRDEARDQLTELEARVEALESASSDEVGLEDERREALVDGLEDLRRLIDAARRSDLEALSTVDRIRLQAALRDSASSDEVSDLLDFLDGLG